MDLAEIFHPPWCLRQSRWLWPWFFDMVQKKGDNDDVCWRHSIFADLIIYTRSKQGAEGGQISSWVVVSMEVESSDSSAADSTEILVMELHFSCTDEWCLYLDEEYKTGAFLKFLLVDPVYWQETKKSPIESWCPFEIFNSENILLVPELVLFLSYAWSGMVMDI